jgi:hypothetical protein
MRGRKWQEDGEDCIMRNFINCTLHRVIILGRMKWVGHVAHMGDMRNVYKT